MFSDISGGFFMLKTIHLLTITLPYPWIFDNLVEIYAYFLDSADERSEC